jgi:iron complex transport system substrate-binding protein
MRRGIDLVLYYDNAAELKKFALANIPAIVVTNHSASAENAQDFIEITSAPVRVVSEALGDDLAKQRYAAWREELSNTIDLIASRTAALTDDECPVVYWGNTWGTDFLSSVKYSAYQYMVSLCGGKLVSSDEGGEFPGISKEQLLEWNPDIVLVDNHGGVPDLVVSKIYENKDWQSMRAIQNGAVYRIPSGVFFMDRGSTQALMLIWLAKTLQPEIFDDLDLPLKLQEYYRSYYSYDLSEEEAQRIIAGWDTEP